MKKNLLTVWIVFSLLMGMGSLHAQDKDSLTLVDAKWNTKQLADGVEWRYYHFKGNEKLFGADEYINIVEVDQNIADNRFTIASQEKTKVRTSKAANAANALAAINGSYYSTRPPYSSLYSLKIDGKKFASPTEYGDYIVIDENGRLKIEFTNAATCTAPTLIGSWPMLVIDGKKKDLGQNDTRDPRTAVATKGSKVFFITVDGRFQNNSNGMTRDELATVLKWLGVEKAINLDGGGSTTMYIKGEPDNGVVNHPSDNFLGFSHGGERSVSNSILLLSSNRTASK